MKIQFMILFFLGAIISVPSIAKKKEYKGKIQITPLNVEQKGDSLYVQINFDISGVNVKSRHSISLVPVLVGPETNKLLPEIMVKGRNNYLISAREVSLMNKREKAEYDKDAPYAILKGYKNKETKHIIYKKVIPYEPWMKHARLDIQEDLCGCGTSPRTLIVSQFPEVVRTEVLVMPYEIKPYLAYVTPAVEAIKRREMVGEAFLDFVVSKIDIRPEYMNNPRELKKITDMVNEVKNDSNIIIQGISIIGYASPEGTYKFNEYLSKGRAKALVSYLLPRFTFPESMYQVTFGGENWIGLKNKVRETDLSCKEEILDIIGDADIEPNYQVNDKRKILLKTLQNGVPYRYMLKEFYPSLRKAICKVDYEVKGFDVVEAKSIINTRPQNLSLNEMFLVANTYPKGSQEFIDVFETAVRMFPEDEIANLNAATAALARKDIISAERYLAKVNIQTPEYNNARGVLLLLKGNYEQAKIHFDKALLKGLKGAATNLEELSKKQENIMLMNKQKRD